MGKNKNRNRHPQFQSSGGRVIDVPADAISESGGASSDVKKEPAPPARQPLLACSVTTGDDGISVTGVDDATISIESRKILRWDVRRLQTKAEGTSLLTIIARAPKRKDDEGVKSWFVKWRDRLGALALWTLFLSYLFRDHGMLAIGFEAIGIDASWEGWCLLILVALLLVWLPRKSSIQGLLSSLYIAFSPLGADLCRGLEACRGCDPRSEDDFGVRIANDRGGQLAHHVRGLCGDLEVLKYDRHLDVNVVLGYRDDLHHPHELFLGHESTVIHLQGDRLGRRASCK